MEPGKQPHSQDGPAPSGWRAALRCAKPHHPPGRVTSGDRLAHPPGARAHRRPAAEELPLWRRCLRSITFTFIAFMLLTVAFGIPARRASRADPMIALRGEELSAVKRPPYNSIAWIGERRARGEYPWRNGLCACSRMSWQQHTRQ